MIEQLIRFPLFKDLSSADLKIIAPLFHSRCLPGGTVAVKQGEEAAYLYLLIQGSVDILYKPYDGDAIKLNQVQAGGAFGWSAVLGNDKYSSSVVCASDCEVLVVSGKDLCTLKLIHPQTGALVMDRLTRAVSARWSHAHAQVKSMINKGIAENASPLGKN